LRRYCWHRATERSIHLVAVLIARATFSRMRPDRAPIHEGRADNGEKYVRPHCRPVTVTASREPDASTANHAAHSTSFGERAGASPFHSLSISIPSAGWQMWQRLLPIRRVDRFVFELLPPHSWIRLLAIRAGFRNWRSPPGEQRSCPIIQFRGQSSAGAVRQGFRTAAAQWRARDEAHLIGETLLPRWPPLFPGPLRPHAVAPVAIPAARARLSIPAPTL